MNRKKTKTAQSARPAPRAASASRLSTQHSVLITRRATKPELRARIDAVAAALVAGQSRPEIIAFAQKSWSVSRRSALLYLKRASVALARDCVAEDRLTFLHISQLQRDSFIKRALAMIDGSKDFDPAAARALASLMTAVCRTIDGRSKEADRLHYLTGATWAAERQITPLANSRKLPTILHTNPKRKRGIHTNPKRKRGTAPNVSPKRKQGKQHPAPSRTWPSKPASTQRPAFNLTSSPNSSAPPPVRETPASPLTTHHSPLPQRSVLSTQYSLPDNLDLSTLVLPPDLQKQVRQKMVWGISAKAATAAVLQDHQRRLAETLSAGPAALPDDFPSWRGLPIPFWDGLPTMPSPATFARAQQTTAPPKVADWPNPNTNSEINTEKSSTPAAPI